jgi:hypothetical protein
MDGRRRKGEKAKQSPGPRGRYITGTPIKKARNRKAEAEQRHRLTITGKKRDCAFPPRLFLSGFRCPPEYGKSSG